MAARIALAAFIGCIALSNGALSRVSIGAPAPAFEAVGADGKHHRLSDYRGKIVVLEWTSPVCPFTAVKYRSGAMQALQRYAAQHQVVWLSVDTAAADRAGYLSPAAANDRIAQTHAVVAGFLFDRSGNMARSFAAKTTPSFFIIDRHGNLAYQGAMDDENPDETKPAQNYVLDALEDLQAKIPVRTPETRPYGCGIEY
jgi:peroxiredoxin